LEDEFGVTGTCGRWISDYLTVRSFTVRVGQSTSPSRPMTTGVPQGSALGPLLYTIYVSPIGRLIASHDVEYHQYVDDIQIFTRMTVPFASAFDSLQGCVELLQYWFRDNGLLLNPNKSAVAYFGTSRRLQCTKWRSAITLTGSSIRISDSLQILGVTLDSTLSLDPHINNIVKNCNYHMQALRHIRPSITKEVANTTICAISGSRLDYCNSMFYKMSDKNFNKLQRIQNRAA